MADEPGQSPHWLRDVTPASWIAPRLHPFFQDVGSVIPSGFEAYVRLFHPVEEVVDGVPRRRRWSDIAAENGRVAHPEMQFHMVSRPADEAVPAGCQRGDGPSWGSLPWEERRVLVELLRSETTTPERCWLCVWDGYGDIEEPDVRQRVELPGREYLLYTGAVELALSSITCHRDQSANLWWPEDRAWFVATEIDYAWSFVGGSQSLITRVLGDGRLEALPARLTDKPFYGSDRVNGELDAL